MNRRRAFTLIELLVVIAIIAVLIAILIPSLARARAQARSVVCISHERALSTTLRLYIQDWGTTICYGGHIGQFGAWDYQLLGGDQSQATFYSNHGRRDASDKIRWCPETPQQGQLTDSGTPAIAGTTTTQWSCNTSPFGGSSGSYGFNDWLILPTPPRSSTATAYPSGVYQVSRLAVNDSNIPVFADAFWHNIAPTPPNYSGDLTLWDEFNPQKFSVTDMCVARHNGAVNVSFFDCHVERTKPPDLWTLQWSATWTRGTPKPVN